VLYGPFAFTAGVLLVTKDHLAWIAFFPAVWFVGMLLSHLVFGRCVLNELTRRLASFKKAKQPKAAQYAKGGRSYGLRRRPPRKGDLLEISDHMATPDPTTFTTIPGIIPTTLTESSSNT